MNRKGVSTLIASSLFIAVAIGAVTTIVFMTSPIAEDLSDTRTIRTMFERMPQLENQIRSVAELENGSRQFVGITFRKGSLRIEGPSNTVEYLLDTSSEIVSPRSSRTFGNIRISAGADVKVNKTVINGEKAFKVENDHVSFSIKKIPERSGKLVGYWEFENEGQLVRDVTGRFNGTRGSSLSEENSDPSISTDCQVGQCLRFDGEDDFVEINVSEELSGEYTVSALAKPYSIGRLGILGTRSPNDFSFDMKFRSDGLIHGDIGNGTEWFTENADAIINYQRDVWYHVVYTVNSSSYRIFINGQMVSEGSIGGEPLLFNDQHDIIIGNSYFPNDEWFNGTLDEIAVYNRTMSPREVSARYQSNSFGDSFYNNRNLLISYNNTDSGKELKNLSMDAKINRNKESLYGFGSTEASEIGRNLPQGNVFANMNSMTGVSYTLNFQLLSGSDFFTVEMEEE